MEVELKTKSLNEILNKCNSLGWDIKKTKLVSKIFEDLSEPDSYYVKLYLKNNEK